MSSLVELHPGTGIGPSEGTLEPSLDIVAVHGLNPLGHENHAIQTWQDKTSGNLWLRDRIPLKQPNARIFLYQYNSSPAFGVSQDRFIFTANDFLERLRLKRKDDPKRPLLLLGHSLGGILIKQALVNAYSNPNYRNIQEATYGLIFFGTPHGGPGSNWKIVFGKTCVKVAQSIPGITSNDIMEALKQGSLFSDALQDQWRHQLKHYQIVTFYEGIGDVVPRYSACLGLGGDHESELKIEAKHGDMCRFNPEVVADESNYELVEGNMLELCEKAVRKLDTSLYEYATDPKAKEQDRQLGKLRVAEGASFDSARNQYESRCMTGTRSDLLQELREWASHSETPIFWLSGMAGTGKSTIARTMAHYLHTQKGLAGTFFFCRGVGDLGKAATFVTTLAHQLANTSLPGLSASPKDLVCEAIFKRTDVLAQGLRSQWKELIVGPLSGITSTENMTLSFVIDALDECDSEDSIRLILQLFIEVKNIRNIRLNVMITSRPEITLLHGFQDMPEIMHRRLDLRDIPRQTLDHDLYIYMKERLGQIKLTSKGQDWPSKRDLQLLVQKADGLFIYAATVCRFVGESYNVPEDCVSDILLNRPTGSGHTSAIDAMYTQVLTGAFIRPACPKRTIELLTDRFRKVVGSIVVLSDVLSISSLGDLLSLKVEIIQVTLADLGSVLDIPSDITKPIRLLHPSFRDFLLDEARCEDINFHIDKVTVHTNLAVRCLDVLCEGLRQNICNLEAPDSSPQEVSDDVLDHCLPKHVQYACQYWTEHLACVCSVDASPQQRSQLGLYDNGKVHLFFKGQFLYWLESMSIMGKIPETVMMMNTLSGMLKPNDHPFLHAIVKDATRLLSSNISIVQKAPLQVYASALVFSPRKSQIREENLSHYPAWFKYGPAVEDHWGIELQTLENDDYLTDVICSFDGKYIACSVGMNIALWNPTTGILQSTLEGHRKVILSMVFSRNGQLASCSADGQVLIWEPLTGIIRRKLRIPDDLDVLHTEEVHMAFAPDGTLAISSEICEVVYIWKPDRDTSLATVKPVSGIKGMTFLCRGELALACRPKAPSKKGEILLYDLGTKAEWRILVPELRKASFSSDDHVGIVTDNGNIRVYDLTTGSRLDLRHCKDIFLSMTFAFSNKGVFATLFIGSVYHWDLKTGSKSFVGTSSHQLRSMVSLPGSKLVLANPNYAYTKMVWIWDVASLPLVQPTLASDITRWGRRGWDDFSSTSSSSGRPEIVDGMKLIAISKDGHHLAAVSITGTIALWNTVRLRKGRIIQSLGPFTYTIALSFHGNYLFSGGEYFARVWDTVSGKLLQEVKFSSILVSAAAFLPNDEFLVIGDKHGTMRIFKWKTWDLQRSLDATGFLRSIAPSQDGRAIACLVSRGRNHEIQVWDTKDYTRLWSVQVDQRSPTRIFFSADDSYITTDRGHQIPVDHVAPSSELKMIVQRWKIEDDWLFRDGRKVLWLSPNYRPTCTALHDDLFIMGHKSGKMTFFEGNTHDSTPDDEVDATEQRSHAKKRVWDVIFRRRKDAGKFIAGY